MGTRIPKGERDGLGTQFLFRREYVVRLDNDGSCELLAKVVAPDRRRHRGGMPRRRQIGWPARGSCACAPTAPTPHRDGAERLMPLAQDLSFVVKPGSSSTPNRWCGPWASNLRRSASCRPGQPRLFYARGTSMEEAASRLPAR